MKESILNARLSSVFEQFGKSEQSNDDLLTAITKVKEIYMGYYAHCLPCNTEYKTVKGYTKHKKTAHNMPV